MKFSFNELNVKMEKGKPIIEHEYVPDLDWNQGDATERVSVVCRYFKSGEFMRYNRADSLGTVMDARQIFDNQVDSVKNFMDEKGKLLTKQEILDLPGSRITNSLIVNVATHLIQANYLTEDETKNS